MKKLIFKIILLTLLSQSCSKSGTEIRSCEHCNFTCIDMNETDIITNDCIDNWECNFKIIPESKVNINETQGASEGDGIVFQMVNRTEGDLAIADDEFTNILVFELNNSMNSFSAEDGELEIMNMHYRTICYCDQQHTAFKIITSGCIQGEKQSDGTWFVQGKLDIDSPNGISLVKFESQFTN